MAFDSHNQRNSHQIESKQKHTAIQTGLTKNISYQGHSTEKSFHIKKALSSEFTKEQSNWQHNSYLHQKSRTT